MKKLQLLLLFVTCWLGVSAQNDLISSTSIDYYGVDFSRAKVFGAKETPEALKMAFNQINDLVVGEYAKYDIGKFFKKSSVELVIDPTLESNKAIDVENIKAPNSSYSLSAAQIEELVSGYNLTPKNELGLVIICELLDKYELKGTYSVVFFNTKSREILAIYALTGKPKGFGLRNFWAGSLYDMMKGYKYAAKK